MVTSISELRQLLEKNIAITLGSTVSSLSELVIEGEGERLTVKVIIRQSSQVIELILVFRGQIQSSIEEPVGNDERRKAYLLSALLLACERELYVYLHPTPARVAS